MNSESNIRKILFNEVSLFIAAVGFVSSGMLWVMNPQKSLELQIVRLEAQVESNGTVTQALERIKNNDLVEVQQRLDQIEARQIDTIKAIAVLQALIKK